MIAKCQYLIGKCPCLIGASFNQRRWRRAGGTPRAAAMTPCRGASGVLHGGVPQFVMRAWRVCEAVRSPAASAEPAANIYAAARTPRRGARWVFDSRRDAALRSLRYATLRYTTLHYATLRCAAQRSAAQRSAALPTRHGTARHGTAGYDTTRHDTITTRYNHYHTLRYNTIRSANTTSGAD